eukprot:GEZU01001549.1.p1 GENE.GEZU01001549.1~~GEZU01001549.1.p1  ORF type:complete len:391 (-),score=142.10 GEZU01001549.1:85-1224(-)
MASTVEEQKKILPPPTEVDDSSKNDLESKATEDSSNDQKADGTDGGAEGGGGSLFKKSLKKRNTIRKRAHEQDDSAATASANTDSTTVVKKSRQMPQKNPNFATTKTSIDNKDTLVKFDAKREAARSGSSDQMATAISEIETAKDFDARSIFERKGGGAGRPAKGPVRPSTNIRISCRFDYQPDICKDYFETGYCGYGDNCKFAHIREDYKTGWQLEKEWEEEQKERQRKLELGLEGKTEEDEAKKEDNLPFACFICRQPFTDPVVTRCKHYFCSKCAMDHYKKSKKCFVCQQPTNGIFNTAFEIIKKQEAEQKQKNKSKDSSGGGKKTNLDDIDGDEEEAIDAEEAARAMRDQGNRESTGWAIPNDFTDNRKGASSWL